MSVDTVCLPLSERYTPLLPEGLMMMTMMMIRIIRSSSLFDHFTAWLQNLNSHCGTSVEKHASLQPPYFAPELCSSPGFPRNQKPAWRGYVEVFYSNCKQSKKRRQNSGWDWYLVSWENDFTISRTGGVSDESIQEAAECFRSVIYIWTDE